MTYLATGAVLSPCQTYRYQLSRIWNADRPADVIAATNLPDMIDAAIMRRFDMVMTFDMPNEDQRRQLIRSTLGDDDGPYTGSHAVIVRDCLREKKRRVIESIRKMQAIQA